MSISSRLKRVEKEAGVGQRCLSCRVHYIRYSDEIKRTTSADLYVTTCHACGQTLKLIHSGYTERERSVLISVSSRHFDIKWLASYAWMQHLPRFLEIKEIGKAEERRLRGLIRSDNTTLRESARKQVKVLDELAAHKQIREANQQGKEATEESRKDKIFGTVFAAMDKVRGRRREIKDDNLFSYYVMAEMEVFMWGEKSKETLQLIEDRERQIVEAEEVRKREAEERERQREEERRLREEERKRQDEEYLARQRQPQDPLHQPTTAANHPFWSQGGDETDSFQLPTEEKPDLLKSLMPPAAYEAYRNAQKIKEKPSYPVALPQGTER